MTRLTVPFAIRYDSRSYPFEIARSDHLRGAPHERMYDAFSVVRSLLTSSAAAGWRCLGFDVDTARGDGMSDLENVALATARLLATVHGLADDELYEPSMLPGWNRAHVLTHLARNADGHIRMLSGARVGELHPQYPSRQARSDAIEAGAGRPSQAIVEDLERACSALAAATANMPPGAWDADVQPLGRAPRPARQLQRARLREVEVHHVDLASTYGIGDWSLEFAVQLLEEICTTFAVRGDKPGVRVVATDYGYSSRTGPSPPIEVHGPVRSLAAWLAGRHVGDDLATHGDVSLPVPPRWA